MLICTTRRTMHDVSIWLVGGGGLLAGCSLVAKNHSRDIDVIAAEPSRANDFYLSFHSESKQQITSPKSIADGLLANSVGHKNWDVLSENVDSVGLVSENEILEAMTLFYDHMNGMLIEPSGAVSIALLISRKSLLRKKGPIVCVVSGGNVDIDAFPQVFGGKNGSTL